jgi:hypothetical protein
MQGWAAGRSGLRVAKADDSHKSRLLDEIVMHVAKHVIAGWMVVPTEAGQGFVIRPAEQRTARPLLLLRREQEMAA